MSTARTRVAGTSTGTGTGKGRSRERIVQAAVALADEHGIAELSMRKLAAAVDCEAMSLYNHVPNKAHLLDAAVDAVAAEVEYPAPDIGWKDGLRSIAESTFEALLRHPWAIELWTRQFPLQHRFTLMERLLELLARADLDDHLADVAFHAVHLHIIGFAQQAAAYANSYDDDAEARFEREVDPTEFPRMIEHKRYHDDVDDGSIERQNTVTCVLD